MRLAPAMRRRRPLRLEALEERVVLAPVVSIGEHLLLPNTPNQVIPIYVSGGELVLGMNLNVQVADGGPEAAALGLAPEPGIDGPAIQNLDILSGTIFASNNTGEQNPEQAAGLVIPQWECRSVTTSQGTVAAAGKLATITIDTTGFARGTWALRLSDTINGPSDFAPDPMVITDGSISILPLPTVMGRHLFYNNSYFDGRTPGADAKDDGAIAPDKVALLPDQTASFRNVSSFARGLNGIMVDLAGLPAGTLTAADFQFLVGNSSTGASWTAAPPPTSISVRPGAGIGGSDRVTLLWADRAIQNQWLQVTVLATPQTGLSASDVFYFGNLIGETGFNTQSTRAVVNTQDLNQIRGMTGTIGAEIDNVLDINRDRTINTGDLNACRSSTGLGLWMFTASKASGASASASMAVNSYSASVREDSTATDRLIRLYAFELGHSVWGSPPQRSGLPRIPHAAGVDQVFSQQERRSSELQYEGTIRDPGWRFAGDPNIRGFLLAEGRDAD